MDKSKQFLVNKVLEKIKEELPDIDDPFWDSRENVERHLTDVMKKFFRYEVGQTEFIHDQVSGDVTVIIRKPVLKIRWDFITGEDKDD